GGEYGYWWNAESKLSIWWQSDNPTAIPSEQGNWFYGVHPTSRKRSDHERARIADIAGINCVFADFDAADFGDKGKVREHLDALPAAPSVIADSGGGYHCYWFLRDPFVIATESDRDRARQLQASWVALVKGDIGAKDLARVLRIPGTRNFKPQYAPNYPRVDFVRTDWERGYTLEDLERLTARVGRVLREFPIQPNEPNRNDEAAVLQREIDQLLATVEGKRNAQLNKAAFTLGQLIATGSLNRSIAEARLFDSARAIGLGEREAIATIRSGLEAGMRVPHLVQNRNSDHPAAETVEEGLDDEANLMKARIAELEAKVEQVPADTDKLRLPLVLRPILEELAPMGKAISSAFLNYKIKPHFGLTYSAVRAYESDLAKLRDGWEQSEQMRQVKERVAEEEAQAAKAREMTDEERAEAMALLQDPRLFERIIQDITTLGYVGEDANKVLQYLVATSRKQDCPLSAVVKSPSAWGKSEMVKKVARLMPPEDVAEYTRLTAQSLAYLPPNALQHKFMVVTERNGSEESDYTIRVLQSENVIRVAYATKDPLTGEMRTRESQVNGPMAYTETTTRPTIHSENATRVFELYLDGTEKQTQRIHEVQRKHATIEGLRSESGKEAVLRRHRNAQRLLEPVKVAIPYADLIKFPADVPRTRRDLPRFLEVIKAIAFLRQKQKPRKTDSDATMDGPIEYIEADLADYDVAYRYAAPAIAAGLDELPEHSRALLGTIRAGLARWASEDEGKSEHERRSTFTRSDIATWARTPYDFVVTYVRPLENREYLEVISGGQGKKYVYKMSEKGQLDEGMLRIRGLSTPAELAEAIALGGLAK
ncbi:MAG: hypothetical protein FJ009_01870, partial [Chloroflexi bacterium]|nr:hypothetical protein [Chloroflexota bacterium]